MNGISLVRSTFLHYIADNLGNYVYHGIRRDPNDRHAELPRSNAVNIAFGDVAADPIVSSMTAYIDLLYDDENTSLGPLMMVSGILTAAYFCPLPATYTIGGVTYTWGGNIFWDRQKVKFRFISNPNYVHYSAAIPLHFRLVMTPLSSDTAGTAGGQVPSEV